MPSFAPPSPLLRRTPWDEKDERDEKEEEQVAQQPSESTSGPSDAMAKLEPPDTDQEMERKRRRLVEVISRWDDAQKDEVTEPEEPDWDPDDQLNRALAEIEATPATAAPEVVVTQTDLDMYNDRAHPEVSASAAKANETAQLFRREVVDDRTQQLVTWLREHMGEEFPNSAMETFWLL